MSEHHDPFDPELAYRELDHGRRALVAPVRFGWRDDRREIAHDVEFARPSAEDRSRIDAAVGTHAITSVCGA
jgi:hypothetical protein